MNNQNCCMNVRTDTLELFKFILERIIGVQKPTGKVRNYFLLYFLLKPTYIAHIPLPLQISALQAFLFKYL